MGVHLESIDRDRDFDDLRPTGGHRALVEESSSEAIDRT